MSQRPLKKRHARSKSFSPPINNKDDDVSLNSDMSVELLVEDEKEEGGEGNVANENKKQALHAGPKEKEEEVPNDEKKLPDSQQAKQQVLQAEPTRRNAEMCGILESLLNEMLPDLEKTKARRLARQFASLRGFQRPSKYAKTNRGGLKLRLKAIARVLLETSERQKQRNSTVSTSASATATARSGDAEIDVPLDINKKS